MFRLIALATKAGYRACGGLLRLMITLAGGTCGPGLRLERGLRIRQGLHSGWTIGTDVYIGRNTTIDCLRCATLFIGDRVTLTEGTFISVVERVQIGEDCLVGEYCSIRDANHSMSRIDQPIAMQPMEGSAISLSPNVWIGRGCAVLAGCSIGTGAVVGANSVVTRPLAANGIYAGTPAKLIRMRSAD